jgi:hypothetical protein
VRGTVLPVPVCLGRGKVGRPGARVVAELAMTQTEGVGWAAVVHAARVVMRLADQPGQSVAGSGASKHGRYRASGFSVGVVLYHGYC